MQTTELCLASHERLPVEMELPMVGTYVHYCRTRELPFSDGQKSPLQYHNPVNWHDMDSASYMAVLIRRINDAKVSADSVGTTLA